MRSVSNGSSYFYLDKMCRPTMVANDSSNFFNIFMMCDLFQVILYYSMAVNVYKELLHVLVLNQFCIE